MSRAISIETIIESTLDGIDESFEFYQEWSGGEWLWNAPEYFITVKIAENIAKINGAKYITLEDNVKYILDLAQLKGKAQASEKARANGRSDIVLWYGNEKPRAIIEVKNAVFGLNNILEDIERIQDVLEKFTLQFCLIAFYMDRHYEKGNANQKVEENVYKIFEETKEKYPKMTCELYFRKNKIIGDDTDAWSSVVILFKAK
ncbi:hypothetical protein FCU45_03045 [Sulfurimonas crateris]|uniref:Uncharacterized protein n=1 Tax=Sulfurimonas crateris TaxID=2574727 RepID=A0A4U2Z9J3_9BACT|nr:hypothetical protein [Sulfurimonas crateris]TKI70282.1 hypothetical protein FCU45_03045 [Sulfurimonas crateris]